MGFIGQNGAGKTTTIKRLLGLVQGGGEVHLLGEKEGYSLRKVKEEVGVFLEGSFFNEVIQVQDIDSILSRITPRWEKGYYSFLLDRFQIPRKNTCGSFPRAWAQNCAWPPSWPATPSC